MSMLQLQAGLIGEAVSSLGLDLFAKSLSMFINEVEEFRQVITLLKLDSQT